MGWERRVGLAIGGGSAGGVEFGFVKGGLDFFYFFTHVEDLVSLFEGWVLAVDWTEGGTGCRAEQSRAEQSSCRRSLSDSVGGL